MAEVSLELKNIATTNSTTSLSPSHNNTNNINITIGSIVDRICSVCHHSISKYTCPKCNLQSCTLECYKKHNSQCQQKFQSEIIHSSMTGRKADEKTKQKMNQILQNFRQQQQQEEQNNEISGINNDSEHINDSDDDDGDNNELIKSLIDAANINSLSLELLTESQRKDFHRAVIDGRLSRYIQQYKPWWTPSTDLSDGDENDNKWLPQKIQKQSKIKIIDDENNNNSKNNYEEWINSLPLVTTLLPSNISPSPYINILITQSLFAYAFLNRIYNGEILSLNDSKEQLMIASEFILLSPSLMKSSSSSVILSSLNNENDVRPLLNESLQIINKNKIFHTNQYFNISILRDIAPVSYTHLTLPTIRLV